MRTPVRMRLDIPADGESPPRTGGRVHPAGRGSLSARETRSTPSDSSEDTVAPLRQRTAGQRGLSLRGGVDNWKYVTPSAGSTVEYKPNGAQTAEDEWEDEARKRDPLRNKKSRLVGFILYLVTFSAVSLGARPSRDI